MDVGSERKREKIKEKKEKLKIRNLCNNLNKLSFSYVKRIPDAHFDMQISDVFVYQNVTDITNDTQKDKTVCKMMK